MRCCLDSRRKAAEEDSDTDGYKAPPSSGGSSERSDLESELGEGELRCPEQEWKVFEENFSEEAGGIPTANLESALLQLDLKVTNLWAIMVDQDDDEAISWEEFQVCVNHLLVEEAKDYTLKAEGFIREVQKEILEGNDQNALKLAVENLHCCWERVSVRMFLRWLQAMEEDPRAQEDRVRMLDSFILRVPDACYLRDTTGKDITGIRKHTSFGKLHGDIMKNDNVVVKLSDQTLPLEGPTKRKEPAVDFHSKQPMENLLLGHVKERFSLAYFTLPLLQSEQFHVAVNEIERASVDSRAFATLMVSVILKEAWSISQRSFYLVMILDFVVMALLSAFATDARNQRIPSRLTIFAFFIISLAVCVNEVCVAVRRIELRRRGRRRRRGWGHETMVKGCSLIFDSFWSFYEMSVALYFYIIITVGIYCKWELLMSAEKLKPEEESWLYNHAIWVEFLVFFKTIHFAIKLLCVRALGERLIPAFCALTHKSSLGLLVFLGFLYYSAALTFHAVPVRIYSPDDNDRRSWDYWENWFDLCVLQFRLLFLGEGEPDELEGNNERVKLNVTGTGDVWEGEILSPSTHTRYHHGVQVTNVLFIILVHILVLNVYIGVLTQQYNNFVLKEGEHFEKFRAFFAVKILIGKDIYRSMIKCFEERCFRCPSGLQMGSHSSASTWVAYRHSLFPAGAEVHSAA